VTRTIRTVLALGALFWAVTGSAIDISNRFRSPRNPERKVRPSTRLIILHTTEAPARSSLNKVSDRGECHFVVTEEGSVYRIVDRDREAFHAGRSMWCGAEDVDKYSVGIECVGYHNKAMPTVQLSAIRQLVKELQAMYRLTDDKVIAHSHVAYGAPNRWQKRRHRGRKRCGMLFAMNSVRRQLGLGAKPSFDPDTRSGRLAIGDPYLNRVLYGGVDTMKAAYPSSGGTSSVPGPWTPAQTPTRSVAARSKAVLSKPKAAAAKPSKKAPKTIAELKARGYVLRGTITKQMTALKLVGAKWNAADTYYTIRGKVLPGSSLNPKRMERGMQVWTRRVD